MPLELKNLSKHYDNKILFKDFSYRFNECGLYAIRGESGAGKTTLLRIIAGLDNDYSGSVDGGGVGQVGFAFQEYRLFPQLTALQNISLVFSGTKSEAECKEMLFSLGLSEEDLSLYPSELSGGMKQRVSLARAFISNYKILLLDEPTKELDKENITLLTAVIQKISEVRLVVIVTHSLEDIECLSPTILQISRK